MATANTGNPGIVDFDDLGVSPRLRLAILVSHPIQYFAPVYRALAMRPDIDLTVVFHCTVGTEETFDAGFGQAVKWDIPLLEGYNHCFLSSTQHTAGVQVNVILSLLRLRPDVLIIHGYTHPTNLLALAFSKVLRIKTLLRGDTRLFGHHKAQSHLVRWAKSRILRSFDGCLSIGSLNGEYYVWHGVSPWKVFAAPFCVDNARFKGNSRDALGSRRAKRKQLKFAERDVVVLFASKLVQRKRAADLLSAFVNLAPRYPHLRLVIAGAGEQRSQLEQTAGAAGLQERIRFLGFVNQSQLPALYSAADIFVLPSEDEPWGLVLNEVMAAGLPAIVSDGVGAAADLVKGHDTGIIYPVGDITALTDALAVLIKNASLRINMAKRASALIGAWDVNSCVSGIADAAYRLHIGSNRTQHRVGAAN